jgi:hypothetical protein
LVNFCVSAELIFIVNKELLCKWSLIVSNACAKTVSKESDVSNERRQVLKKLGRFGAYTAPVMIAAFATSKAASASEGTDTGAAW